VDVIEYGFLYVLQIQRLGRSHMAGFSPAYLAADGKGTVLVDASSTLVDVLNRLGSQGWIVDSNGIYGTNYPAPDWQQGAVKEADPSVTAVSQSGTHWMRRYMKT
jgi:hypothetical protein